MHRLGRSRPQKRDIEPAGFLPALALFLAKRNSHVRWAPVRFARDVLSAPPKPREAFRLGFPPGTCGLLGVTWIELYTVEQLAKLENRAHQLLARSDMWHTDSLVDEFFDHARGVASIGNWALIGRIKSGTALHHWKTIDLQLLQVTRTTVALCGFAVPSAKFSADVHVSLALRARARREFRRFPGHLSRMGLADITAEKVWREDLDRRCRAPVGELLAFHKRNVGAGLLASFGQPTMTPCWYHDPGAKGPPADSARLISALSQHADFRWVSQQTTALHRDREQRKDTRDDVFSDLVLVLDLDVLRRTPDVTVYGGDLVHAATVELEKTTPGLLALQAITDCSWGVLLKAQKSTEALRQRYYGRRWPNVPFVAADELSRELARIQLLSNDAQDLVADLAEACAALERAFSLGEFAPAAEEWNLASAPLPAHLRARATFLLGRAQKALARLSEIADALSTDAQGRRSRLENRSLLGLTTALLALGGVQFWAQTTALTPALRAAIVSGAFFIWLLVLVFPHVNPLAWYRRAYRRLRHISRG